MVKNWEYACVVLVVVSLSADIKYFTGTVHFRLGPVFSILCGDLSGEHRSAFRDSMMVGWWTCKL